MLEPERRDLCRPAERHERLDEGEDEGGKAEDGVGVGHNEGQTVGPAASVEDNEDDPSNGSCPDEEHEEPVPEEPLILPTTLPVSPGLLVVASQEDARASTAQPGDQHHHGVTLQQQITLGDRGLSYLF